MKKALIILLAFLAGYTVFSHNRRPIDDAPVPITQSKDADAALGRAFAEHASNLQVEGQGLVEKLLPDDTSGSRHQKFIVRLNSGQTLQIAHNIDLAPRVDGLAKGDEIAFSGQYEWNPRGGVVHWTHLDPAGRHTAGWLRHNGRTYQ